MSVVAAAVLSSILLAAHEADPCALRHRAAEPASGLLADADKATGRGRACLTVVAAVALEREGKRLEAAAFLKGAAEQLPLIAADLGARAARLEATPAAAGPAEPQTPDAAAARITALIAEARPKEAAALATTFPRPAGAQHDALEVATVTALVRADRIDEALAHAARLLPSEPAQKVRAWAFSKARRYDDARAGYAALAAATADPALKADTTFYAAFSAYEANELALARTMFSAAEPVVKGTQFEAFSRWYLGLSHILDAQHADAVTVLTRLVADLPQDKEVRKHRYWLARSHAAAGNAAAARAVFEGLVREDPTDWYGLLARARLGTKPLRGKKVAGDAIVKRAHKGPVAERARLLHALALDAEVRGAVRVAEPKLEDIGLAQSVDDFFFGYRRGPSFLPYPRAKGDALVAGPGWRASYATPWRSEADAAAGATGIAPSFLYAIVRTESGFDPRAVSIAGARGATQLLPSVARGACVLIGRPETDADRLFEPEVSLLLGATILGLHKRELGSMLLAAAAYNGAPQNVAAWMKDHGALEVELFVERIPFRETRDYVKKVLATEALYRGLEGGDVQLELPAKIGPPPDKLTTIAPDR